MVEGGKEGGRRGEGGKEGGGRWPRFCAPSPFAREMRAPWAFNLRADDRRRRSSGGRSQTIRSAPGPSPNLMTF